jgi:hypothetical protein
MYYYRAMRLSYRARIYKPIKSKIDYQPHGIDSLESIPGPLKCFFLIRALYAWLRFIASISCRYKTTRPGRFWASVANLCHGENAVFSKGVGPSTTLACPGWEQPDISVKVDRHDSKTPVQERLCKICITALP